MSRVIFSPEAVRDLERLRAFLLPKSASAAQRAADAILSSMQDLGRFPAMGRLVEGLPDQYREWLIDFGDSGYVARYRIHGDMVVVLAIRHQKEAGY